MMESLRLWWHNLGKSPEEIFKEQKRVMRKLSMVMSMEAQTKLTSADQLKRSAEAMVKRGDTDVARLHLISRSKHLRAYRRVHAFQLQVDEMLEQVSGIHTLASMNEVFANVGYALGKLTARQDATTCQSIQQKMGADMQQLTCKVEHQQMVMETMSDTLDSAADDVDLSDNEDVDTALEELNDKVELQRQEDALMSSNRASKTKKKKTRTNDDPTAFL
jgi:hypothetical protein